LKGIFVTGTDTGIGKTVTAAALLRRLRGSVHLRYWKPIQTGIETDDDTSEVCRLAECRSDEVFARGVRLPRPLSPHLSARLSGQVIDIVDLLASIRGQPQSDRWIVEGAGGVLVPLNDTALTIDFMVALHLPVVVVARSTLGTINHTLLTLEALRARRLTVAGVVLVGDRNPENRRAIECYGRVAALGELPRLDPLTPQALAQWADGELDPHGRLTEWLQ
jgi:dethiobiotin synthetase